MGVTPIRNVALMMVVIILMIAIAESDSPASKLQAPFSKWTVHISNQMASGDVLYVHCKSKEDDLGLQIITSSQEFSWNFRETISSSTLYWCYFRSSHGYAEFEVFWKESIWHKWLADHCNWSNCIWNVKDDGIYLRNVPRNTDDYKNNWIASTS